MSAMDGNPNYEIADVNPQFLAGPEQAAFHQTQAILALAYEQRTANLIAAYQAEVTGTGRVKGIGAAIDRHNEILDRLGL